MIRAAVAAALLAGIVTGSLAEHSSDGRHTDVGRLLPIDRFEVTSGAWRASPTDPTAATTSSPTFRARSERDDLGSPEVDLRFRIDRFLGGPDEHDWDGVHVGLRYASPDDLYYVSVARRDDSVAVKRKSGGRYVTLAVADHELGPGWHRATVSVAETPEGTQLRLAIDGRPVLAAFDDIHHALPPGGRVSVRSDGVSAAFADARVRDLAEP